MKKYIGVILIALLVLVGCGGGSKSSQGKAIIDAVYEYNSSESKNEIHFDRDESNATVYESGSYYYVLLEKQKTLEGAQFKNKKYISEGIYKVKKHGEFSVSQSDIEPEYDEDILKSATDIFYEEKNVELVEN